MEAVKCFYHPEKDATGTCEICGKPLCDECGVELDGKFYHKECLERRIEPPMERKSPGIAAFLSIIFPGLGIVYAGDTVKGIAYMLIFIGTIYGLSTGGPAALLGIFLAGFYLFAIVDSYNTAKAYDSQITPFPVEKPDADKLIRSGIFWIVVGGILQLATLDLLSLGKILKFWPLILILLGVYLIVKYFQEKGGKG